MPSTIKHIVVLMMENRSFDHMLGYLHNSNTYNINGLTGRECNPGPKGEQICVSPSAHYAADLEPDPGHDHVDCVQQVYENSAGNITQTPSMLGFVRNYATKTADNYANIMRCFDPTALPVLCTLAKQYAVCTQWFSSVPGPTNCNRAFTWGGTSLGVISNTPDYLNLRTFFQQLDTMDLPGGVSRPTYKIYYHDISLAAGVRYFYTHMDRVVDYSRFSRDCKGTLPSFCFIEPRFGNSSDGFMDANSQHPDGDVSAGEELIADVYNTLRESPAWNNSLLVIVYDEHGGLYDHAAPPSATPPDKHVSRNPPFAFNQLGLRIPAVLVSPFIPPRTIDNRVYDHTSIMATARRLLISKHHYKDFSLTNRDRNANTFDSNLKLTTPRQDTVQFPAPVVPRGSARFKGAPPKPLSDHMVSLLHMARSAELTVSGGSPSKTNIHRITTHSAAHRYFRFVMRKLKRQSTPPGKQAASPNASPQPTKVRKGASSR